MTCAVSSRIGTGSVMETFDFNYTVAIIVAVLVSLGRIVTLLFATAKTCELTITRYSCNDESLR